MYWHEKLRPNAMPDAAAPSEFHAWYAFASAYHEIHEGNLALNCKYRLPTKNGIEEDTGWNSPNWTRTMHIHVPGSYLTLARSVEVKTRAVMLWRCNLKLCVHVCLLVQTFISHPALTYIRTE